MKRRLIVLVFSVFVFSLTYAQKLENTESKNKAIFIYGFTKYFEWPAELKKGDFKIGVLGLTNELVEELNKIAKLKRVDGQMITIVTIEKGLEESKFPETQILVYDAAVINGFKISKVSKNSLVISDNQSDGKNSMIGFFKKDSKIKFLYNRKNLKSSDVKAKPDFEKLAAEIID